MALTTQRIEELASGTGVKRIPVENFLSTLGGVNEEGATANAIMDARLYRWNEQTFNAIKTGIRENFAK